MATNMNEFITTRIEAWSEGISLLDRLFLVARPGAVFSEPVSTGSRTVITASEISVGLGFGQGAGGGSATEESDNGEGAPGGMGAAGGGGGASMGRPVAVIVIDENRVRVEPVVDVTKIALAFFTMFGSMLVLGNRMRQAARG